MKISDGYIWSDVCILQCILIESIKAPASLKDIIRRGDMINRIAFSAGELQHGFKKFIKDDLLIWKENKVSLSENGKKFIKPIIEKDLNSREELKAIQEILNAKNWEPNQKLPEFEDDVDFNLFTVQDVNDAYEEYKKEFSEAFNKLKKTK